MVEIQFFKHIKNLQSDNALEYTQYAFQGILHSYGTVHQLTCPGTFQQNGRAERKLCHILDTVHALLLSSKVPAAFGARLLFMLFMLFMLLTAFSILSSRIKFHMSTFLGHLLTITTFTPAYFVLPILFLFNRMSITNLSLSLDFVAFLAMVKLKRGIGVTILSLIIFVSPTMLSFRNIFLCQTLSLLCLPIYILCFRSFSR